MAKRSTTSDGTRVEFRPLNEEQKRAWNVIDRSTITFLHGVAGTAKTHIATAYALDALCKKAYSKVYISRPVIEAGESLGYLPGTYAQKINPYLIPIYDCIGIMAGEDELLKRRLITSVEVFPLAYARGRTMENAVCILDEAQNATIEQLKLWLTRIGRFSKMIVTGDVKQSDIGSYSGFGKCMHLLQSVNGVSVFEFTTNAIVRHPIVGHILEALGDDI